MRPLLKESFMFKVSKNAKISFFVKSKNLAVVRVTNGLIKAVQYFTSFQILTADGNLAKQMRP